METKTKLTTKERNTLIHSYILGCIDSDGYGVTLKNDKERINWLLATFKSEKLNNHANWLKYYGSEAAAFTDWCRGLPSCFNIVFSNYDILNKGIEWGLISDDVSEKKEDNFIEQYWTSLYRNVKAIEKELNRLPKLTIY